MCLGWKNEETIFPKQKSRPGIKNVSEFSEKHFLLTLQFFHGWANKEIIEEISKTLNISAKMFRCLPRPGASPLSSTHLDTFVLES